MANLIFGLLILVLIIVIFRKAQKNSITTDSTPQELKVNSENFQYRKKNFLTASEKNFLASLCLLEKHNLIIVPQINLATIVQKVGEFRFHSELFRNIDFGVFDKDYNLLLLIELNDSSHLQSDRRRRDMKVKDIVSQAGIKLITFYTDKPNKAEYVVSRVLSETGLAARLVSAVPAKNISEIRGTYDNFSGD